MNAFFAGVIFGAVLVGVGITLFITRRPRKPRREPIEWTPEFHEPPPPVSTRVLINRRDIQI